MKHYFKITSVSFLLVFLLYFSRYDFGFANTDSSGRKPIGYTDYNEFIVPVRLKYVVDGDTVAVDFYGRVEKVRVVGIDTPERGKPFFKTATEFAEKFLKGKIITIEVCSAQRRDKHGRLLAWVYADGESLEEVLLRAGLARTLFIPPCGLRFKDEYKHLENSAKDEGLGLWRK